MSTSAFGVEHGEVSKGLSVSGYSALNRAARGTETVATGGRGKKIAATAYSQPRLAARNIGFGRKAKPAGSDIVMARQWKQVARGNVRSGANQNRVLP